jgi:nucleoid DNA-binding protein
MEDVILSLLKENERIILPDFGAFIIKSKTPFKVIFNEFLQYNDGTLIGALADKLIIDRDDATNKVKEYVADITKKLSNGESVELKGIGIMNKSNTGKITLIDSQPGMPDKTSEPKENATSTVEFDLTETKKDEPKVKASTEAKKEDKSEIKATKEETKEVPPPIEKPSIAKEKTPEIKTEPKIPEPTPITEYYDDNISRNRRNVIIWIILIALVNGAIIGYFLFDDEIKALFGNKKGANIENTIETPIITDEILPTTDSDAQIEVIEINDASDEFVETEKSGSLIKGEKYYVVAGVFEDEENADRLVKELVKKGYNSDKFGKIGSMYAVSYDVFPTKQEADRFMLKIKREVDAEAWIRMVK